MTPRRSITEKRRPRGFIVPFPAITAIIMLIAQPVAVNAERLVIDVKDGAKVRKLEIVYDSTMENVVATVDGKEELNVSKRQPYPIELGPHTKRIVGIYPGPIIVFEGSTCVLVGGKWIGYPPGTICP